MSTDRARPLRNDPTPAERALWKLLSAVRPRFTRQLQLDPFYADLACRRARVIVEVDGSQHTDSAADTTRTAILQFQTVHALIAEHPLAGAVHDTVRPPIRSVPCGSHRVFYDGALRRRILHKAVDVERRL